MRLLHSESSLAWGGQENRIRLESSGMMKRGHEVSLIVQPESRLYSRLKDSGLKIYPVRMRGALDLRAILSVLAFIRRNKIQIVHTHSSIDTWVAGIAAKLYGKAVIFRTRHVETPIGSVFPYRYLCHRIVTTGENIRRMFIDKYNLPEDKIVSIPTGVDLDFFSSCVSGEKIRSELSLDKDTPLIGNIGIFRGKKGHRFFLEACAIIKVSLPRARFLIVGEGPIEKHIRGWIEEFGLEKEVSILNFREDINEVLAAIDILVMSSIAEGVPQIISQALAMEKGVVATSIGGIPELIKDNYTGLLVPPQNSSSIAGACLSLIRDKSLSSRLGLAGRKLVEEKFSLDSMLDRIEELYLFSQSRMIECKCQR